MIKRIIKLFISLCILLTLISCGKTTNRHSTIEMLKNNGFEFKYSGDEEDLTISIVGDVDKEKYETIILICHFFLGKLYIYYSHIINTKEIYFSKKIYDNDEPLISSFFAQSDCSDQLRKFGIEYDDFIEDVKDLKKTYKEIADCEDYNIDDNNSTEIIDYKYAKSFKEYSDYLFEDFNASLKENKKYFRDVYTHSSSPYIEIELYSQVDFKNKDFKKACENIYKQIVTTKSEISYRNSDIYINLSFFKHHCNKKTSHYVSKSCYERCGYMQFDVRNSVTPDFNYE